MEKKLSKIEEHFYLLIEVSIIEICKYVNW